MKGRFRMQLTKNEKELSKIIRELYFKEKLTIRQISYNFDLCFETMRKMFIELGIERDSHRRRIKVGERFGRLVIVADTGKRRGNSVVWGVICDCNQTHEVKAPCLIKGETTSCGCKRRETSGQRFKQYWREKAKGELEKAKTVKITDSTKRWKRSLTNRYEYIRKFFAKIFSKTNRK